MPAPPAPLPTAVPGDLGTAVSTEGTILHADVEANSTSPKLPPWSVEQALTKASLTPLPAPTSTIPFLHLIERLKTTPREGWRRFSIAPGESIADHMYRMAIITLLAPPSLASKLDLHRCTQMALVHDMGEALVGDLTPMDGVSKVEKSRRETLSMDYLLGTLLGGTAAGAGAGKGTGVGNEGGSGAAQRLRAVWQEYEDSETMEAKFVHDVDKLELVLQMMEYERRYEGRIDLGEFAWVASRIELREMKEWALEVLEERTRFWEGIGKGGTEQEGDMPEKLRAALGTVKAVDGMENGV